MSDRYSRTLSCVGEEQVSEVSDLEDEESNSQATQQEELNQQAGLIKEQTLEDLSPVISPYSPPPYTSLLEWKKSKSNRKEAVKKARLYSQHRKTWYLEARNTKLPGKLDATNSQSDQLISKLDARYLGEFYFHLLPVAAIAVIVNINLTGMFLGTHFLGVNDARSQSIALLCLQVTAKFLEFSVIASLGFIILSILHHFLFFDEDGLPFGLAGSRLTFTNLYNAFTPSFWTSIGAIRSRKARILVATLLISCALLATFIGPAAAVLLIPTYQYHWPAGGLQVQLPDPSSELWPAELSVPSNSSCTDVTSARIHAPTHDDALCLWFAAHDISAALDPTSIYQNIQQDGAINIGLPEQGNLTVHDIPGLYRLRQISWQSFPQNLQSFNNESSMISDNTSSHYELNTWAWTGMSFSNLLASSISYSWVTSVNNLRQIDPLSPYARYFARDKVNTQGELIGASNPAARTVCIGSYGDLRSMTQLPYPVIPLYGNYPKDTQAAYLISTPIASNTTGIQARWVPKPSLPVTVTNEGPGESYDGSEVSAFLAVTFPDGLFEVNSDRTGRTITCSVDARWVKTGKQISSGFDSDTPNSEGSANSYTTFEQSPFDEDGRPVETLVSPPINLDISWLSALTPQYNGSTSQDSSSQTNGSNLLTDLISNLVPSEAQSGDENLPWGGYETAIEALVPFLVVDGMARFALSWFPETNAVDTLYWMSNGDYDNILGNISNDENTDYLFSGHGLNIFAAAPTSVQITYNVFIAGYAYSAETTGSILALIVVLTYVAFAFGQVIFTLYKRWFSTVWWSVSDIISLAHNSPASNNLRYIPSERNSKKWNRVLLKLRMPSSDSVEDEIMHLVVQDRWSMPEEFNRSKEKDLGQYS